MKNIRNKSTSVIDKLYLQIIIFYISSDNNIIKITMTNTIIIIRIGKLQKPYIPNLKYSPINRMDKIRID